MQHICTEVLYLVSICPAEKLCKHWMSGSRSGEKDPSPKTYPHAICPGRDGPDTPFSTFPATPSKPCETL